MLYPENFLNVKTNLQRLLSVTIIYENQGTQVNL